MLPSPVFACSSLFVFFFFFNDTATTEIYTLSLHDALPILMEPPSPVQLAYSPTRIALLLPADNAVAVCRDIYFANPIRRRSEEHTSELQSQSNLVCRLLLEKKKKKQYM